MSHHSSEDPMETLRDLTDEGDKGVNQQVEAMQRIFDDARKAILKQRDLDLCPTGDFPDGKIDKSDEGGIKFAVYEKLNRVIVDFAQTPVYWLGLEPEQAIELGEILIKHGEEALKVKAKS